MELLIEESDKKYQIKISDDKFELNVHSITLDELVSLSNIYTTDLNNRNVLEIGISAGSPVFWGSDEDKKNVSILVGEDINLWDFGITLDYQYFLEKINMFIYSKPTLF